MSHLIFINKMFKASSFSPGQQKPIEVTTDNNIYFNLNDINQLRISSFYF